MGSDLAGSSLVGVAPGLFVGRNQELARVSRLLDAGQVVTLVGPPGVGKTRLGREVVTRAGFGPGIGGPDAAFALDYPSRPVDLVVFDDCENQREHVAGRVREVLASHPGARVLVTSRVPLGIEGEAVVRLGPLECPGVGMNGPTDISGFDAVVLFVDRARQVVPTFELTDDNASAVSDICRAVDGVPLALALVAAKLAVFAPATIAGALAVRASVAVSSPTRDPRHGSLEMAIGWSYAGLPEGERVLLRRLSVFSGSFTTPAAEHVCSGHGLGFDEIRPALERLVESSLVVADMGGEEPRYRLLNMIRTFSADRLREADELVEARARHGRWALSLAYEAEAHLTGPAQQRWLRTVDSEIENLRAAKEWFLESRHLEALDIVCALTLYWRMRGLCGEGLSWFKSATNLPSVPLALQAKAHWGSALMLHMEGHTDYAVRSLVRGIEIARAAGEPRLLARALLVLAACHHEQNEEALLCLQECLYLANEVGDDWTLTHALVLASSEHARTGDSGQAIDLCGQAVTVARRCGDPQALTYCLISLAGLLNAQSATSVVESALREALEIAECESLRWEQAHALARLGALDIATGHLDRAEERLSSAMPLARALGRNPTLETCYATARLLQGKGELHAARNLLESRDSDGEAPLVLRAGAQVASALGHPVTAAGLVERALGACVRPADTILCLLTRAQLSRRRGNFASATADVQQSLELCRTDGPPGHVADTLEAAGGLVVGDEASLHAARHAARLFGAAEAIRRSIGTVRFAPDGPDYETDVATLSSRLTSADVDAAWAGGEAMTPIQAVDLARRGPGGFDSDGSEDPWERLSASEWEAIDLLAEGLTYREMAARLYISPRAVKARFTRAFDKTGLRSRAELTRAAAVRNRWARRNPS